MKKRKIFKCATLCAMVVIVLVTAVLPSFAWQNSQDTARHADCVFTLNGTGEYFYEAYYTNYGEYYYNTFGDKLLYTAPRLRIYSNGWTNLAYQGEEASYYVYLNCDDNSGQWLFKVYDYVNSDWYTFQATSTNIYTFFVGDYVPIIYNQNIHDIMVGYSDAVGGKDFMLWSAFKTADQTMIVIPTRYNNTIGYNGGYQQGYTDGHGVGLQEGIEQGFAQGQTDITNTSSTLREFIGAIFTAPSYFINTVFDFNIFGFNVAGIVKAILGVLILGVIVTIVIKFML